MGSFIVSPWLGKIQELTSPLQLLMATFEFRY